MMTRQQAMAAIEELGRRRQQFGLSAAETIELSEAYRAVGLTEQADELRPRRQPAAPEPDLPPPPQPPEPRVSPAITWWFEQPFHVKLLTSLGALFAFVVLLAILGSHQSPADIARSEREMAAAQRWADGMEAVFRSQRLDVSIQPVGTRGVSYINVSLPGPATTEQAEQLAAQVGWAFFQSVTECSQIGVGVYVYLEPGHRQAGHHFATNPRR